MNWNMIEEIYIPVLSGTFLLMEIVILILLYVPLFIKMIPII